MVVKREAPKAFLFTFRTITMSTAHRIRVLFDEDTIAKRNEALAQEIAAAKPENLLVVAVLKGSFMFAADLIRALHRAGLTPQVEFVHLSSYLDRSEERRVGKEC